jgi:Trk-type K+ transport system membrane component
MENTDFIFELVTAVLILWTLVLGGTTFVLMGEQIRWYRRRREARDWWTQREARARRERL